MATVNIQVGSSWTKIAEDGEEFLASNIQPGPMEYATTTTDAPPAAGIHGHSLGSDDALTRAVIGGGYVWARMGDYGATGTVVVSVS